MIIHTYIQVHKLNSRPFGTPDYVKIDIVQKGRNNSNCVRIHDNGKLLKYIDCNNNNNS